MLLMEHLANCGCGFCVVARFRARQLKTDYYTAAEAKKNYDEGLQRVTSNLFTHDYQDQYAEAAAANR